jgi:hypothetical protein
MKPGDQNKSSRRENDAGVATIIEYIIITGVLISLFVVVLLLTNTNFIDRPANIILNSAFTDISNGISTRIVDTYAIAPVTGNITSRFDIPDDIAGRSYIVEINNDLTAQTVSVKGGSVVSNVAIAGIGSSQRAGGNTTGSGMNRISYNSGGFI